MVVGGCRHTVMVKIGTLHSVHKACVEVGGVRCGGRGGCWRGGVVGRERAEWLVVAGRGRVTGRGCWEGERNEAVGRRG